MTINKAILRIQRMEKYMDDVIEAVKMGKDIMNDEILQKEVQLLSEYMDSGVWLSDYERYEAGKIPKDVKCGVLSQDALYNLLVDIDQYKRRE